MIEELDFKLNEITKKYNVILIDGPWGTGKTYQINKYMQHNKNVKYISLFGMNSIEELSEELFKQIHPNKYKGEKLLKYSLTAINAGISMENGLSLSVDPEIIFQRKIKSNQKTIVLDDLERLDFTKLNMISVLGYVERMVIKGLRIIILCNSLEISSDEDKIIFGRFKEKVVDKEIILNGNNEYIIKTLIAKEHLSVERFIDDLNGNIRLFKKGYSFYKDIVKTISAINPTFEKYTTKQDLFEICEQIVIGLYSDVYLNKYKYYNSKKPKDDYANVFNEVLSSADKTIFKNDSLRINAIAHCNNINVFTNFKLELLISICFAFKFEDYNKLKNLFNEKNESILDVNYNLLSDEEVEKLFKDQIDYIISEKEEDPKKVFKALTVLFKFAEENDIYDYQEQIKKHIIENYDRYCDVVFEDNIESFDICNEFRNFFDNIKNDFYIIAVKQDIEKINKLLENCDYETLDLKLINTIRTLSNNKQNVLYCEYLKKNNYFLDDLTGDIKNIQYWNVKHSFISLAKSVGCLQEVINYSNKLTKLNPENKALKRRLSFLLDKYNDK